jgi:hypothetical protein
MSIYENEDCRITLPNGYLPGLYEGLWARGIRTEGGVSGEFASDPAAAQAFIDTYTEADALAYAKTSRCAEVLGHAKKLRDQVVAPVSAGEMASWPIKRAEALRYATEGDAGTYPLLSQEAAARGISLAALVAKVDGNAAYFAGMEAAIGGNDGRHRDAIMALETIADVLAYDFSTGWPTV